MLLETFIKGGKPVAGICYGSIALAQVKDSLTGVYLLQGHFATGHGDADNYTEDTATMNPDGTSPFKVMISFCILKNIHKTDPSGFISHFLFQIFHNSANI